MAHLEMVGAMVTQLTQGATAAQLREAGLDPYYADHGTAIFPQSAAGIPWSAMSIQSKGDPIADLHENLAAEQKARATYEYLLDLIGDEEEVATPIKFLREREIVHFQRFGDSNRTKLSRFIEIHSSNAGLYSAIKTHRYTLLTPAQVRPTLQAACPISSQCPVKIV